jgi:hypothetical protein
MRGDKCLRLRNLLKKWKVDMVCFQETKLEVCLIVSCVVCEVAIMWIGVIWTLEGLQMVF